MKDWKTTTTAVVTALVMIANTIFDLELPVEAILTVAILIVGFFAKDGEKE